MSDGEVWVQDIQWCPFGQGLPNPIRCLVIVGHVEHIRPDEPLSLATKNARFVADRAHLMLDLTDARRPKLDIPLSELRAELRDAYRHPGGSATRPLWRIPDEQRRKLRLDV